MSSVPADLRMAASLGGQMGSRILSYDWEAHPLGDPAEWSAAVRTTVATALACRFPTALWLGDQLRLIYNDGYIPMLGDSTLRPWVLQARTCGGISGMSSARFWMVS